MSKAIFSHDRDKKTTTVEKTYNAPLNKVWEAWTKSDILDKWWGPQPWKAVTKSQNFSEGGRWHYYMSGPEGEKHWCLVDYTKIVPEKEFSAYDAFCDQEGNVNKEMPSTKWHVKFEDLGDSTKVIVVTTHSSLENMDKLIAMGFEQGFTTGLTQLEELL